MIRPTTQSERLAPPRFLLPAEFDAEAIVGPLKADAARWIVSTILRKLAAHDVDARGFAILSATVLERVMGRHYVAIVRSLIGAGVLARSPYREGRSYGYRLADEYLAGHPRSAPVANPVIRERIRRERKRHDAEQAGRRLPIHCALDDAQQGMTILPDAGAEVEKLPVESRLCQRVHIDRIARREFPLTISTTGRIFNGLSGVKRNLRPFIRLDGEPIGCVDISNSQPALLGNLLASKTHTNGVKGCRSYSTTAGSPCPSLPSFLPPASVRPFLALVSSGVLYEELAQECNRSREFVKKRFLVDVLAKKGRYPSRVEDVFRRSFPEVWRAIQDINETSHCNLIRMLQRLESWFAREEILSRIIHGVVELGC